MRKKGKKEIIITDIVDEIQERIREGEKPDLAKYIKQYPEYSRDIERAVKDEMTWNSRFSKVKTKVALKTKDSDKEVAWNQFNERLSQLESTSNKSFGHKKSKGIPEKIFSFLSGMIHPLPIPVRIAMPALITAIVLVVVFSTKTKTLSDLADIQKIPYIPTITKSVSETDRLFQESMTHYNNGDYSEAIDWLLVLTDKDPTHVEYIYYLGLCYLLHNHPDESIKYFNRIIVKENSPYYEKSLWYLGNGYLLKEDADKALEIFRKINELESVYSWDAEEMVIKIEKLINKS
jgi:tetratricopeptide (TPR) repeat protein